MCLGITFLMLYFRSNTYWMNGNWLQYPMPVFKMSIPYLVHDIYTEQKVWSINVSCWAMLRVNMPRETFWGSFLKKSKGKYFVILGEIYKNMFQMLLPLVLFSFAGRQLATMKPFYNLFLKCSLSFCFFFKSLRCSAVK